MKQTAQIIFKRLEIFLRKPYRLEAAFIAVECVFYFRLLRNDFLTNFDDETFVGALRQVTSFSSYIDAIMTGKIPDIQPIRDVTFFLNFYLEPILGFTTFHAFNLLIWAGTIVCFHRILMHLKFSWRIRVLSLSLLVFNPFFVWSVAWVWARKHLLACLFVLSATERVLSAQALNRKNIVFINVLFFLACFSQPIAALFPVWVFFYFVWIKNVKIRDLLPLLLPLTLICLFVLFINNLYYQSPIFVETWGQKIFGFDLGTSLLALGRLFINFVFPFKLSTYYYQGSVFNIVGLFLLSGLIILLLRLRDKALFIWLLFWLAPLAITNSRTTYIFIFNTYALSGSFGLLIIFSYLWRDGSQRLPVALRELMFIPLCLLLGFFSYYKWRDMSLWQSNKAMWEHSHNLEQPAKFYEVFALNQFRQGEYEHAKSAVRSLFILGETDETILESLYCESSFFMQNESNFHKEGEMRFFNTPHSLFPRYFEALTLGEQNYKSSACAILKENLSQSLRLLSLGYSAELFMAELDYYCHLGRKDCGTRGSARQSKIITDCDLYEYRYYSLQKNMCHSQIFSPMSGYLGVFGARY